MEGIDESFAQAQWLMPSIVERALIHQDDSVDPYELLEKLDMSTSERLQALQALQSTELITSVPGILTTDECNKMIRFIHKQIQNDGIDDVDGCPDWQVNMKEAKLIKILGSEAVHRLWSIPRMQDPLISIRRVGIFVRLYQRGKRPWMPFHRDANAWTVNVALNQDYQGGRLLALYGDKLHVVERQAGEATCHSGSLFHAVSAITTGTRYSLILFFHE
jgi:hypothetical protein